MAESNEMILDLSNYKDRVGARVTPDRYRVQVEDAEATKANSGNPMINLWFRIIGGEFDGQTIVDRLVITEKSLFRVVGFMQAIGLPTPKKRMKINIRQFIGKTLDVDVADGDPYQGRIKSEVRGYARVAKAQDAAADSGDELDEFDESVEEVAEEAADETPETNPKVTDLPEPESKPNPTDDFDGDIDTDEIEL